MTTLAHRFDPTVLREYDIRGIVGQTLSEDDARAVGRGFGSVVAGKGGRKVAAGRDGRLHSPALHAALVDGLASTGLEVIDVGLGPTPMLYFASRTLGVDAGVQVTGSHNPADYNGFKMSIGTKSFWGDDIRKLGQRCAAGDFVKAPVPGRVTPHDVREAYVGRLLQDYRPGKPLAVVWDNGNGAGGEILRRMAQRLPGRHVLLNDAIDGRFPAHHPDPTVAKNLVQLQDAVAREQADLGVAFDGDADRIGVVDGKGRILWGDQLMAVYAREILGEKPGSTIIADVKASQTLFDEIARLGGVPLMWRTGHSIIKTKMAETGAPLAGEMSGHIFFADRWYGFDDALYAAIRLLSIVARSPSTLAEMRDQLPTVLNTPELRFPVEEVRKFAVVDEVRSRLAAAGARVNDVDGVRVSTSDGWWLLRASNTQDVLVARCESRDAEGLARLKAALVGELGRSSVRAPADL
ncbi:MAG: phosphomannomutase/phosphoglucomutase [Alphaproteobacteria bacterium]|nr:phosphomannomutase/phosphoglucomutase [Alphaproteobacteria bacterium]